MNTNIYTTILTASDAFKNSANNRAILNEQYAQAEKSSVLSIISKSIKIKVQSGEFRTKVKFDPNCAPHVDDFFNFIHKVAEDLDELGYLVAIGKDDNIYTMTIDWGDGKEASEIKEEIPF